MIEVTAVVQGPPSALLDVLAVLGTGGLLTVAWQMYLRWKRGGKEDEELVSRISSQVAEGSAKLLEEYRIELEVAQRQIKLYLDQVTELNRLLGSANERIDRLERQLMDRQGERRELNRQLKDALKRREEVLRELKALREHVQRLEDDMQVPPERRHDFSAIEGLERESGSRARTS
jgi:chromosome segregation ATPase